MHYLDTVPELSLVAACLERAILDACGCHFACNGSEDARADAREWIFRWEHEDEPEKWTFQWACEALELCPHRVKRAVCKAMRKRIKFNRGPTNYPRLILQLKRLSQTEAEVYFL